jgi:hypothetical protein
MGKYIRWAVTAIVIVAFIGGIALFIAKLLSSNDEVVQDKPSPEQQAIIDKDAYKAERLTTEHVRNASSNLLKQKLTEG